MADWLTHILIGWTFVELVSLRIPEVRKYRWLVIVGSVLPDLGNFTLLLGGTGEAISLYLAPLKTPVGITLLILAASLLLRRRKQKLAFVLLAAGSYLHLLGDFLIRSLNGRLMLFFPFSFELYGLNVFEQGAWAFPLVAGALALTSTALWRLFAEEN